MGILTKKQYVQLIDRKLKEVEGTIDKMKMSDLSRRVAESLGIHWHNTTERFACSICGKSESNPDFSSDAGAVALLRILEKREVKTA